MWFTQANPGVGLCGTSPLRRAILRLYEPEKSCCRLLEPVLWPGCGRFHGPVYEESIACSKDGLRVVWLESLPSGSVWLVLNDLYAVLWPNCDRFRGPVCEVSMACSRHGLRVVWLKSCP